jgi:hypothetical protein
LRLKAARELAESRVKILELLLTAIREEAGDWLC